MKKKILALLVLVMLIVTSCGNIKNDSLQVEEENNKSEASEYDALLDVGWSFQDKKYIYTGINEECRYACIVEPDSDKKTITLELEYEYGTGNNNIIEMYKNDNSIAVGLAATWLGKVLREVETELTTMQYKVSVGEKIVGKGTIGVDEAESIAAEYNEY